MYHTLPLDLRRGMLTAIVALLAAIPAQAAPFVIGVEGSIEWPALRGLYGEPSTIAAESGLAKRMVAEFKTNARLRYWTFDAISPSKRSEYALVFRFSAVEVQPNV